MSAVSDDVLLEVNLFRYRERMHLSYEQLMSEPFEEIQRAFVIWAHDAERDKLEVARSKVHE